MSETKEKPPVDKKKLAKDIKFYSYAFLAVLLLFVTITNCFVRVTVEGISMETTYHHGETLWASKWKKPVYGNVVILENPYAATEPDTKVVLKRVRGSAGDKFWFDTDNNLWRETAAGAKTRVQIGVDPEKVQMIFLHSTLAQSEKKVFTNYGVVYTVPSGCVFVLGDNFDASEDSRYYGGVPAKSIIGVIYG